MCSKEIYTPLIINNDREYYEDLKDKFNCYIDYITNNKDFNLAKAFIDETRIICDKIFNALKLYYEGRIQGATSEISEILKKFINSNFIISNLDDSYAFRMLGKYEKLHTKDYDYSHLTESDLIFFRARISEEPLINRCELSHIPTNKRELTSTERFCIAGIPCLYLSVSTYTCWQELGCPPNSHLYCSSVKFTEEGKGLKILNLTIPIELIWGIGNDTDYRTDLQQSFIKIYPLIMATSYNIKQKNRKFKSEYIVSQLIMHCLKDLEIDGVAYMSTKTRNGLVFPLNVNLALPVFDKDETFRNKFELTKPMSLESFVNLNNKCKKFKNNSTINNYYEHNNYIFSKDAKYFLNSVYRDFDDYLVDQEHKHSDDES